MSRLPKYQQVTTWVESRIAAGELKAGDRLESENVISELFGLSRQTVRHALGVLEEDGFLDRVQGSGTYVRDLRKKSREEALSHTVTIISTYVDGYIFPKILQAMVRTLEKAGYGAKIMFTNNHLETERHLLERILEEDGRDAMIVEPVMSGLPNPNLSYYQMLQERGIPILFFHSYYPELPFPHVGMDDGMVGRTATEYLIAQGHRRIGGIFKADDGQGRRRYAGYLQALRQAEIPLKESRVCWIDTRELREGFGSGERILKRLEDCTACFCYNDEAAHVLTRLCSEKNIRIPEDLSIASVDNSELARLNSVPLTSVAHPMEVLGQKAAENILGLIRDPDFDATYEFEAEIETRNSVTECREQQVRQPETTVEKQQAAAENRQAANLPDGGNC